MFSFRAVENSPAQNKLQNDCVKSCEILVIKGDILILNGERITMFAQVDRHLVHPIDRADQKIQRTKGEVHN